MLALDLFLLPTNGVEIELTITTADHCYIVLKVGVSQIDVLTRDKWFTGAVFLLRSQAVLIFTNGRWPEIQKTLMEQKTMKRSDGTLTNLVRRKRTAAFLCLLKLSKMFSYHCTTCTSCYLGGHFISCFKAASALL